MHILILGATSRTGRKVIERLLSQNHTITALLRSSSSSSSSTLLSDPNLTTLTGSLTSPEDLAHAIQTPQKANAVIISLASLRASESPFAKSISSPTMMTDIHSTIISAMGGLDIKRIITISAFGVGSSRSSVWWPLRWVLYTPWAGMRVGMEDHGAVEELVRTEGEDWGLEWTLVRPVMLSEGSGKGKKVVVFGEDGKGTGYVEKVSRETVAGFVVRECVEKGMWVRGTPVIGEK